VTLGDSVNALVDAIIDRLDGAKASLGISTVTEGDELPTYIEPGTLYVIPLIEGKDTMRIAQGDDTGVQHDFPVTLVGYYKATDIATGLRPTRSYGYAALDLFVGGSAEVLEGTLEDDSTVLGYVKDTATLEVGYARITDYAVHWFIVKMQVTAIL